MFNIRLTKILGGVLVATVVAFIISVFMNVNRGHENTLLSNRVAELSSEISMLTRQLDNCQRIQQSLIDSKGMQENEIGRIRENEEAKLDYLKKLLTDTEDKNESKVSNDSGLPGDLSRLLNDHCAQVRGETCPNP